MKQYVIDQLRESDFDLIQAFLDENAEKTVMGDVYRIELPKALYTPMQLEHDKCHPFYFAVDLNRQQVAFELLIRSLQVLRCNCIGYATSEQREYIINFADQMLEKLGLRL
jgi:hypothetical protein